MTFLLNAPVVVGAIILSVLLIMLVKLVRPSHQTQPQPETDLELGALPAATILVTSHSHVWAKQEVSQVSHSQVSVDSKNQTSPQSSGGRVFQAEPGISEESDQGRLRPPTSTGIAVLPRAGTLQCNALEEVKLSSKEERAASVLTQVPNQEISSGVDAFQGEVGTSEEDFDECQPRSPKGAGIAALPSNLQSSTLEAEGQSEPGEGKPAAIDEETLAPDSPSPDSPAEDSQSEGQSEPGEGKPAIDEDHAVKACAAAPGPLNYEITECGLQKVPIGVNTGEVCSGTFGSDLKMKFGCVGDPVNLASRLEALGKVYDAGIIVSGTTHETSPRDRPGEDRRAARQRSRSRSPHKAKDEKRPGLSSWPDLKENLRSGSVLAKGSFATVTLGSLRGRKVAIKSWHIQDVFAGEEVKHEHGLLQGLNHPRIVRVYGACLQPPLIILEWMPAGSLHHLLHEAQAKTPLTLATRAKMALQVCEGLDFLHGRAPPIVHRDLKSSNILVDLCYDCKICDLGLSQCLLTPSITLPMAGSPLYFAPECFGPSTSTMISEKVDCWAAGCVLVECFGGAIPNGDLHNMEQLVAKVKIHRQPPDIPIHLPCGVLQIVEDCFEYDPERRASAHNVYTRMRQLDFTTQDRAWIFLKSMVG